MQLKNRAKYKQLVVIKLAPVGPTKRPNNPAIKLPNKGRITIQRYIFYAKNPEVELPVVFDLLTDSV